MALPPYVRNLQCPGCGHGIYVPERPAAGVPEVMSGCRCAWLREAVRAAGGSMKAREAAK